MGTLDVPAFLYHSNSMPTSLRCYAFAAIVGIILGHTVRLSLTLYDYDPIPPSWTPTDPSPQQQPQPEHAESQRLTEQNATKQALHDASHGGEGKNASQPSAWPFKEADEVKAYFSHVGKAGGVSLRNRLKMNEVFSLLPCRMNESRADHARCEKRLEEFRSMSVLKSRIYAWKHLFAARFPYSRRQYDWLNENTNLVIFSVRRPVERIVSAFNYHLNGQWIRKKVNPEVGQKIFGECFHNVQDLARAVGREKHPNTTQSCRELGIDLLHGKSPAHPCTHFRWNYQHYVRDTWPNRSKAVAVVRTESLWPDAARLEGLLGGDPESAIFRSGTHYSHGSERFAVKSGVTPRGAADLCCGLRPEIQTYRDLIVAAVNLHTSEKVQTMWETLQQCGINRTREEPQNVLTFDWLAWDCRTDLV